MLRYKLKERIADKEFAERRRVTIQEIAQATGITRNTLVEFHPKLSHFTG
jgi:putative transcriptional regulator